MIKIGIAGLGKLGLSWAVILASKGFEVHGVDINENNINLLKKGKLTISETGSLGLFKNFNEKLNFYKSFAEIKTNLDYVFIVVPTPSLPNNHFDSSFVIRALKNIDNFLNNKVRKNYTNIIVTSTVMPGECDKFLNLLSKATQESIKNEKLGFCYNPEFIALGTVIENILNPDFILIGSKSTIASDHLANLYKKVNGNNIDIRVMSLVSAEITKISINTYLTLKISFANTIGILSDKLTDAEKFKICSAIGADSRIGGKFLNPGLGFGGPCLPRDTKAFEEFLKINNLISPLSKGSDEVNKQIEDYFSEIVRNKVNQLKIKNPRILFSGITYKQKSWLLEKSQAFQILLNTMKSNLLVDIYEELASEIKANSSIWKKYYPLFDSIDDDLEYLITKKPDLIILFSELPKHAYLILENYIDNNSSISKKEILDIWSYQ